MGPGKGTPGEAATFLGIKDLGEATGALSPGFGVFGLKEVFLDIEAVGFTVRDMLEGFREGDMLEGFTEGDMFEGFTVGGMFGVFTVGDMFGGLKAEDRFGGFMEGEMERVTPGGNLRLISSRLGIVPLPDFFVIQLFVLAFKSLTIFVLTLSLIIANFLTSLILEIGCLPPAILTCSFKRDTTVEPLFRLPPPSSLRF